MDDFRFAVIADAHFHDIEGDYGITGPAFEGRRLSLRSWAESSISTRVFNESHAAFIEALRQIRDDGIRDVVLLGDYSDDGQRATLATLSTLLRDQSELGLRFHALPGNHDIFALSGRHHNKEFISADGGRVTVSSRPGVGDVHYPPMYCDGYPAGLLPMKDFGFFRRADDRHWESPFGLSDRVEDRLYEVVSPDGQSRHRLMDASYLIEPSDGVWFMMIDANVFAPRNGFATGCADDAFEDSTSAGWNAMLVHKPFILDWIADVQARARRQGKKLLLFSHYPVLDPFEDEAGLESRLFGSTSFGQRKPQGTVAARLLAGGGGIHFSGHLHVHRTTRVADGNRSLVNVALPSLVAFPAGWKSVTVADDAVRLQDRPLSGLDVDARIAAAYRAEAEAAEEEPDPAFSASTYGAFLSAHLRALIDRRYVARDWPAAFRGLIDRLSYEEACAKAGMECTMPSAQNASFRSVVYDWYFLRFGGAAARREIAAERLATYEGLRVSDAPRDIASESEFLRLFLAMLGHFARQAKNDETVLTWPREHRIALSAR
jgi:3',5'-cyclic AMP phosphodiesterase CpdA